MIHRIITIGLAAAIIWAGPAFSATFEPWHENVFAYIKQEFGEEAEKRMRFVEKFIIENQDIPEMEKVIKTNQVSNHLPWIADATHWKESDYWATPLETITTFGGDCEDIALVKWVILRNLGVSADNLALAYVKIKATGEDHMVLLYVAKPEAPVGQKEVYVLDNYVDEVKLAEERMDLLAVLALGTEGRVVLFNDDGKNRSVKASYEGRKVKKVEDLIVRVQENRAKFAELNAGRSLMPN
jgi:predicted transglutaminase-like cysteine proteinase